MDEKKQILKICMQKGFLLDKEILESLSLLDGNSATSIIDTLSRLNIKERVITRSIFSNHIENLKSVLIDGENRQFVEQFFVSMGYTLTEVGSSKVGGKVVKEELGKAEGVRIISSDLVTPKKIGVIDFVKHFRNRYEQMRKILQERNIENLKSIRRLGNDRDSQNIIVMITEKKITKNKNIILEVEDLTGKIKILINSNKKEIFEKCKHIFVDQVVVFSVTGTREMLFVNDVIFPDSYLAEKKKSINDVSMAVISDVHVGSSMFLEENFLRFIKWINGVEGTDEQKKIAKKIKYLFIVGDTIDGVGVFPDQEKLLKIPDTINQYKKLTEFLKLIRNDIRIIICPGQHDAVWVGEPQPAIGEFWAPDLHSLENVILVTNPSIVEIEGEFKVLMYHGASMHGLLQENDEIRVAHGHNSPTILVKELLKARHLSPLHGISDYVPNEMRDPLVIDVVPDIMLTGDWHRSEISTYNNILLIASSCWQSITPFEEKVGNNPDPCKVPVFNLRSREIKILDFSTEPVDKDVVCNDPTDSVCEVKK